MAPSSTSTTRDAGSGNAGGPLSLRLAATAGREASPTPRSSKNTLPSPPTSALSTSSSSSTMRMASSSPSAPVAAGRLDVVAAACAASPPWPLEMRMGLPAASMMGRGATVRRGLPRLLWGAGGEREIDAQQRRCTQEALWDRKSGNWRFTDTGRIGGSTPQTHSGGYVARAIFPPTRHKTEERQGEAQRFDSLF